MSEKIYIQENGKVKEAKGETLEQILSDQAEYAEQHRLLEAEQQAKEVARQSAMDKLSALGLSEDEVKAIIGA